MTRATKAAALLMVLSAGACSRTVQEPVPPGALPARIERSNNISGYVLTSGEVVRIAQGGWNEMIGDTIIAVQRCCRGLRSYSDTLRVADITHVQVRELDGGRTAKWILIPVGAVAVLALAVLASSCPFVYAYDGSAYVPVAEPLGGAVSRGLARTDLSELENIAIDDGMYRIVIANEIDETQYIDMFHLLAIDHPAHTKVVPDRSGTPRVVGPLQAPVSVRAHDGTDLRPVLGTRDEQWWPLDEGGPGFAAGRTRDTLTFAFERPAGTDSATLVLHARNSIWGAYMVKRLLQMWGSDVDQWYRLLDNSVATRQAQEEWVRREETWMLNLWVREDAGWAAQEVVVGGGPYISELQAVPLDLSRVTGPRVEVRLHPPLGYWRIDFAGLADGAGTPAAAHDLHPAGAVNHNGAHAAPLLRAADGRHLVLTTIGERVSLDFAAPPPPPDGFVRTLFSRTAGHYRVHTDAAGPRLAAQLDSIWLEPGFPVRFAEREYAAWQKEHPAVTLHPLPWARPESER